MGRLVILHTMFIGGLISAYFLNILPMIITADRVYALPTIGSLMALGSLLAAFGKWDLVEWLADKLPVLGLIFTVTGLLLAVGHAQGVDLDSARMQIFTEVSQSLSANLIGMVGYAWLSLIKRVCS